MERLKNFSVASVLQKYCKHLSITSSSVNILDTATDNLAIEDDASLFVFFFHQMFKSSQFMEAAKKDIELSLPSEKQSIIVRKPLTPPSLSLSKLLFRTNQN